MQVGAVAVVSHIDVVASYVEELAVERLANVTDELWEILVTLDGLVPHTLDHGAPLTWMTNCVTVSNALYYRVEAGRLIGLPSLPAVDLPC